jgi:hypothetical protein
MPPDTPEAAAQSNRRRGGFHRGELGYGRNSRSRYPLTLPIIAPFTKCF